MIPITPYICVAERELKRASCAPGALGGACMAGDFALYSEGRRGGATRPGFPLELDRDPQLHAEERDFQFKGAGLF